MSQDLIKQHIESPATLEKFGKIFGALHKVPTIQAQEMFEVEKFHFLRHLQEKNLQDVTPVSAMGVFLEVVGNRFSFSTAQNHIYLMARNVNVGTREQPRWEKRLVYSKTYDGKIYEAQNVGALQYVTDPVIVYEGEEFTAGTNEDGKKFLYHKAKFPRTSNKIIAGYVFKVFPNDSREPFWLDMSDVDRMKAASAKQNKGTANALYSSGPNNQIDVGFFSTKIVNMALKYVRKSGIASQFEVNGDAGDAAMITGATELPVPEEDATFEVTSVTSAPEPAQPTITQPAQATQTTTISSPVGPEPF